MGKSKQAEARSIQKYGVPFYAAAWIPPNQINDSDAVNDDSSPPPPQPPLLYQNHVVLAGGGGEGSSGIPNAIVLSHFDFGSSSLSPQPVAKLGLGPDLPYRTVVHPGRDGLICALPNSCRLFEWDEVKDDEAPKPCVKASEKKLTVLEDIGQQLALAFSGDGSVLAVGGEDGNLRVFKWPSMDIILNEAQAHTSVKDICFSPDGKFLVSLGDRGPGRVWDVTSSTVVAPLSKENDEILACCRFSPINDKAVVLYVAAITVKGGSILTWNTSSWKRISSKHVVREPVSSFSVSPDGKHLAIGTAEGDVLLINSTNMRVQTMIKNAHLGIVTSLAFSHDSRALVSASMDSSARVTLVEDRKSGGLSSWIIIVFFVLLAIAAYFIKNEGFLPFLG